MTSFRVKLRRTGLSSVLLLALGGTALAAAPTPIHGNAEQDAPAAGGAPPVADAPTPGAPGETPPAPAPAAPEGTPLRAVGSRPGANDAGIEVGTLGAPDPATVGLFEAGDNGLPDTAWLGTPRVEADRLLTQGLQPTPSRALQVLTRKLLLSRIEGPKGGAGQPSFLTVRLRTLLALGDLDDLSTLMRNVPKSAKTSDEQRVWADALLISNDESGACDLAADMRRFDADPFWVKLGAYCEVRGGQTEAAELAVNLLRLNGVDDPAFYELYEKLAVPNEDAALPSLTAESPPLLRAMAKAAGAGAALPPNPAPQALYRRVVATGKAGTPWARLAAAFSSVKYGTLPDSVLPPLFAAESFTAAQLGYADSSATLVAGGPGSALLYQSVHTAPAPEPKMTRLLSAFRAARAHGYGAVMAELLVPDAQAIPPAADFINSAPDMIEFYLAARQPSRAYDWYFAIDSRRSVPGLTRSRYDHLAALLQIAARNDKLSWEPRDAGRMANRAKKEGGDDVAQRAFELNVLAALGYPVDADDLEKLPSLGAVTDAALTQKLSAFQQAAASGHVAEGAARAVEALGKTGPAGAPQAAVVTIVRGLKSLGLESDARAIALEAALGLTAGGV